MTCPEAMRHIPSGPRSVKSILCALAEQGPLTMQQLQEVSGLGRRTVYGAVRHLRESGLLAERPNLRDMRQTWYSVQP